MNKCTIPSLTDWLEFPCNIVDAEPGSVQALSNDCFPLELHGDLDTGSSSYSRGVGHICAKLDAANQVVNLNITYRSPAHQQLLAEIFADSDAKPVLKILGGSYAYKAVVGIFGYEKLKTSAQGSVAPFRESTTHTEQDRENVQVCRKFLKAFKGTRKSLVLHYFLAIHHGNGRQQLTFGITAHCLADLDKIHLKVIQESDRIQKAIGRKEASVVWERRQKDLTLVIRVDASNKSIDELVQELFK